MARKVNAYARPHRWGKPDTTVDIPAGKLTLPVSSITVYVREPKIRKTDTPN